MKKFYITTCICLLFITNANSQTLPALQQQNARATGYAIVAARNPGRSFSVFMIKWDGINNLEYNANNQINPLWHAQAAVKGNFFDQTFVDNNFSTYSSVVVSQSEFDTYKSTGSDWWIVCSFLPPFSNSGISTSENGNVGIGTTSPQQKFVVSNNGAEGFELYLNQPTNVVGLQSYNRSLNVYSKMQLDASQFSFMYGNVGIGTAAPDAKLAVNGTIHSKEVKVDMTGWSDFVFKKEYDLPTLEEVEKHIAKKGHLENIPSEEEVIKNGINLGEMNAKLLQKMEEMTLYMIEQNKRMNKLEKENRDLKNKMDLIKK